MNNPCGHPHPADGTREHRRHGDDHGPGKVREPGDGPCRRHLAAHLDVRSTRTAPGAIPAATTVTAAPLRHDDERNTPAPRVARPGVRPIGRLGAAAMRAAAAGWCVFSVRPRSKVPAVADWDSAATTDVEQITEWWSARPWNVGISAGRSGLLVVDHAHGEPPPLEWAGARGGLDVLARLAAASGAPVPTNTYAVHTPSGGRHLYFRQPAGVELRNTQGGLGWRIDTRGRGGYVLAAGSVAPGGRYCVAKQCPVAPMPAWLLAALTPQPRPSPAKPGESECRPVVSTARTEAYLRAVVDGERRAVMTATVGHRHWTLLRAARRLGQWVGSGALTETDARAALLAAARGYHGVAGYTARQVERDITDGLAYGACRPRRIDDIPDQFRR